MVYEWLIDGLRAGDSNNRFEQVNSTLYIRKAEAGDANRTFTCKTWEDSRIPNEISGKLLRDMKYGPRQVEISVKGHLTAIERTSTDVVCTADCNGCTFSWEGYSISQKVSNTSVLAFISITRNETGIYRCKAYNNFTAHTEIENIVVEVFYGPDPIIIPNTTIEANEGSSISDITCKSDCYPNCTFEWKTHGFLHQYLALGETDLVLQNITRNQAGTYTCIGNNLKTNIIQTATLQLDIYYGPDSPVDPNNIKEVIEYGNLGPLSCSGSCYPNCSTKWTTGVGLNQILVTNKLWLVNISRADANNYSCSTLNSKTRSWYNRTVEIIVLLSNNNKIKQTKNQTTPNPGLVGGVVTAVIVLLIIVIVVVTITVRTKSRRDHKGEMLELSGNNKPQEPYENLTSLQASGNQVEYDVLHAQNRRQAHYEALDRRQASRKEGQYEELHSGRDETRKKENVYVNTYIE